MLSPAKHHLPGILEIDGDPVADDGLDLPEPPVRHLRMAHQGADLEIVR